MLEFFGMLWRPIHVAVSNFSSRRYLKKKAIQSKLELEPLFSHFRIVDVLFNSSTVREPSTLKEHLSLLDKLAPRLRSTDIPFHEVYTQSHFVCV